MDSGAGSLGPRLLGRLTAELIHRSPQYMSCISNYEIDLRGEQPAGCSGGSVAAGNASVALLLHPRCALHPLFCSRRTLS
jgi:hypothetical protein